MSYKISFREHKGRTFEWLFFKAPWYAQWIYENRIYRQEHNFSEEEGDYFEELYRRASHLTGVCPQCNERPITRMGLSTHYGSGALGAIGFFCDECDYLGGSPTSYEHPSFFVHTHMLPRCEQLRITDYIKKRYIGGHERLTQKRMEEFFRRDTNFVNAAILTTAD